MISDGQLEQIRSALDARFGVDAMWLFGSQAAGRATPESDVDIAVLLRAAPDELTLLEVAESLSDELGSRVDIVELSRSGPVIATQALRHGRLICDANRRRRIAFETALPTRYADLKLVHRPIEAAVAERMRRGRA